MANDNLKPVPLTEMPLEERLAWAKNSLNQSAAVYADAQQYCEDMKNYHENLASLLQMFTDLTGKISSAKSEDRKELEEETIQVCFTMLDIMEAMQARKETIEETSYFPIEHWTIDDSGGENPASPDEAHQGFLEKYRSIKSRLGLNTQDDVAKLTGIDRRHISRIESGKSVPQWKTLNKLATAFGVSTEELWPNY